MDEYCDASIDEIDNLNRICYDSIADEYDNNTHSTCRNFDVFSKSFLVENIERVLTKEDITCLDIGVGTGKSIDYIKAWLKDKKIKLNVLDISCNMLKAVKNKHDDIVKIYYNESLHKFKSETKYDLIIATMIDPFLTEHAVKKIYDLLKVEGYLLVTIPDNKWAEIVRKNSEINKIIFKAEDKKEYLSYSFCWSQDVIVSVLKKYNLRCIYSRSLSLNELKKDTELSRINKSILETNGNINFVTGFLFKKGER